MRVSWSGYIYPFVNISASAACFLSIGVLFGFGHASDSLFLILAIQNVFGALSQAAWHAAIPLLFRKRLFNARRVIASTVLINLTSVNALYVLASLPLEQLFPAYFNRYGAGYFFFFQTHLFFKNFYLASGKLRLFYLVDVIGYFLSLIYFVVLSFFGYARGNLVDLLFLGMCCSWGIVALADYLLHRDCVAFVYGKWFSVYCARRGLRARFASLLFSAKDFMVPVALKLLGGEGLVTTYSYVNKIAISLYQVVPIHVVNQWFSTGRSRNQAFSLSAIRNLANRSLVLYFFVVTLAFVTLFVLSKAFVVAKGLAVSKIYVFSIVVVVSVWFGVQSYEQAYARAVYFLGAYNVQATADFFNSVIFFCVFGIGMLTNSAIFALVGTVLSQLISLWIYKNAFVKMRRG